MFSLVLVVLGRQWRVREKETLVVPDPTARGKSGAQRPRGKSSFLGDKQKQKTKHWPYGYRVEGKLVFHRITICSF